MSRARDTIGLSILELDSRLDKKLQGIEYVGETIISHNMYYDCTNHQIMMFLHTEGVADSR